jgi:hypothetical protein
VRGTDEAWRRVVRGGSFENPPDDLRSANRDDDRPDDRNDNLGLRCVRSRARQQAIRERCLAGPAGGLPPIPARPFQ